MFIQNHVPLADHGQMRLRRTALDIAEHALAAADPYRAVQRLVTWHGDRLSVGALEYDLRTRGAVYVLGGGKASLQIARALDEILGARIAAGVVAIKRGQAHNLRHIRVLEAAHPYPDASSYQAALAVEAIARQARAGDLVLTAITGGSSALLCHPARGISLAEKRQVHQLLLSCGAVIQEINAVRKHLSQIKGGLLAQATLPAELVNLTVSDVIGDPLDYIACPVVADTSTVADAMRVLHKYDLWARVAPTVRAHLGDPVQAETPKALNPDLVHTFVIVPAAAAALGAATRAAELGYAPLILSTGLMGESCEVAKCLAAIAREAALYGRPAAPPCALIASGENTVTLSADVGTGGPSQELAASLALNLDGHEPVVALCLDTDGSDGPTPFAGGLIDSHSAACARGQGLDVEAALRRHDAAPLLAAIGDVVITGATGTNVADLVVILVGGEDG